MNNKINMGNAVTMGQLLEFEVAFPGEEKLSVEQYLAGANRSIILNAAVFFLGFKNYKSRFDDNKEFLSMYFQKENNEIANQIYNRIKAIEKAGVRIGIVNTYSSLNLFEYYFSKHKEPETQTPAEFEVNLFKAYLVLNSEFTQKQSIAFHSAQESDEELKLPMWMFCMHYPISDKSNYDINLIWVTQMIKSIYLFQFLETNEKTQPLLTAFLAYFDCSTWQEYLKSLLPLTEPAIRSEQESHADIVVEPGEKFEQECAFIEKLMIQENDELDQNDFRSTRAKPFYKVKEGVYRIIFNLFVVEKIFKGVYFLLKTVYENMSEEEKKKIKIKNLKSFYGDEFSEKILCYKVLESIYPDKCIRFSGKELADMKIDAAPDYYVRKGKDILLVESKDFLIAADKKMSFDFNVYEEEFGKILDYEEMPNGKIKPKAVVQLINSIRRILKKEFTADTDYHHKEIFIYPVLLTHDLQYDTPGFNELIDFWFQDALLELQEEGLFIHHVKPLSTVNIDTLIYDQVGLATDIQLHKILNLYHENKKVQRKKKRNVKSQAEYDRYLEEDKRIRMSKLIPSSMFIYNYFNRHGLRKMSPLMEMVAPAIFKEEYEPKQVSKS